MKCCKFLVKYFLQAVREGLTKATQNSQSASGDVAKAEAQIALECYEAMQKAIDG